MNRGIIYDVMKEKMNVQKMWYRDVEERFQLKKEGAI